MSLWHHWAANLKALTLALITGKIPFTNETNSLYFSLLFHIRAGIDWNVGSNQHRFLNVFGRKHQFLAKIINFDTSSATSCSKICYQFFGIVVQSICYESLNIKRRKHHWKVIKPLKNSLKMRIDAVLAHMALWCPLDGPRILKTGSNKVSLDSSSKDESNAILRWYVGPILPEKNVSIDCDWP